MIHSGTLALFQRALRMDALYARGHLVRLLLGILIFAALVWAHYHALRFTSPGLQFFQAICLLNAGFVVLAGISIFATPITEEKEEGTLGLLKMAGISRVGILLGKSTARVIIALLLLAVQLPFTMLAITLGGITLSQILTAYALLAGFLIYVANLGLFCSVYCRRSGTAAGLTAAVLTLQFLIAPLFNAAMQQAVAARIIPAEHPVVAWLQGRLDYVSEASILNALYLVFSGGNADAARHVGIHVLIAGSLFLLAWTCFDRFTADVAAEGPSRLVPLKRRKRSRPPLGRAWSNALMWKEFHFGTGGWQFMLVKVWFYSMILLITAMVVGETASPLQLLHAKWLRYQWRDFGTSVMVITLISAVIELSMVATCLFRDEVRWHTLAPIIMFSRSLPKMAYSKVAGCIPNLLPVGLAFGVGAWAWPFGFWYALTQPATWGALAGVSVYLHIIVLLSLFVRWGALSISLALVLVLGTFCGMPLSFVPMALTVALVDSDSAAVMPIAYFGLGMTAALQIAIAVKLQSVAAE